MFKSKLLPPWLMLKLRVLFIGLVLLSDDRCNASVAGISCDESHVLFSGFLFYSVVIVFWA